MEFYSLSSAGINHTQQTRGLLCVLKVAVLLVATKGGRVRKQKRPLSEVTAPWKEQRRVGEHC